MLVFLALAELRLCQSQKRFLRGDLDAVRHVGVKGGKIVAISEKRLQAKQVVDATGLVVAPALSICIVTPRLWQACGCRPSTA